MTIDESYAKMLIPDAESLREALVANGFYMPGKSCQLCRNTKFLLGVKDGTNWMPMYRDIRRLPLPRPPMKKLILEAIIDAMQDHPQFPGC